MEWSIPQGFPCLGALTNPNVHKLEPETANDIIKGQGSWIDFHADIFHCQLTPAEDVKSYLKSRFSLSANMYLTAWCNLR